MQLRLAPVTILSLFFLCSFSGKSEASPHTLRIRLSARPSTLDWNIATTGNESAIIQNLMLGLFSSNGIDSVAGSIAGTLTGDPKLALAKSYTWSTDRKDLRIELNGEAEWTDRKKLNSRDFIDSFERLLNPSLNSQNAYLLFDVVGARDYFLGKTKSFKKVGIEAPTPTSLIFHLNEPRANFIQVLTHWSTFPVRKDHLSLTLGPYVLQSSSAKEIVLTARDSRAPIQTARFETIPDGKVAIAQFKAKKIDYLLQVEDSLLNSSELKNLPAPQTVNAIRVVALLHFNPSRVSTNTSEKRRTIMKAIPVQALLASGTSPSTRLPAPSIIPPGLLGGPNATESHVFEPKGKLTALPNDSLTLAYPSNDSLLKAIAEQIQASAKGLRIIPEALPNGDRMLASHYDLVVTLFGLDYFDPDQLLASFLSQGTHDLFNVSSSELLHILENARTTDSIKDRASAYADAADYLENRASLVMPLFYRRRAYIIRKNYSFDAGFQGTALLSQIRTQK